MKIFRFVADSPKYGMKRLMCDSLYEQVKKQVKNRVSGKWWGYRQRMGSVTVLLYDELAEEFNDE